MNKTTSAALSATLLALAGLTVAGCNRDTANTATRDTTVTRTATTTAPAATASTTDSSTSTTTTSVTAGTTMPGADAAVTGKVKAQLLADTTVKGLAIDVDTTDGVVALKGTVKSQAEADRAVQLASSTDGVKSVQNQLTIR